MKCWIAPLFFAFGLCLHLADAQETEGSPAVSEWNGWQRLDFLSYGRKALLVVPKQPAAGKPWIWRTEFFGHEPQADLALLEKGYHLAYVDLQNLYGAPLAIDAMDRFHEQVVSTYGLSRKVVMEGFSRGGLFAFNWAARNPEKVDSIYVDAPVCDFKSWPGGKGKGKGSPADWKRCLEAYGLTEEEALTYPENPIDRLKSLAGAKIPIIAVCGGADEVVPLEENMEVLRKRYEALGGKVKMIVKPEVGHHPHSLPDPAPIVDFILGRR
jgi:pimeloyl-ACP methyl ester carboxylesterase